MAHISEIVLAQIWNSQWLRDELSTTDDRPLRVVYRGVWTHGLGPDFSGAMLDLGGRLESGDVELHRRASGWYEHGHDRDPAYNGVVLHVVLDDDLGEPVRRQDGARVATLALRSALPGPPEAFPSAPLLRPLGAIGFAHCAPALAADAPEMLHQTWEAAGDTRLAGKVATVAQSLSTAPPAQVLYALLLDALGYSRNRAGMAALAERLRYDHLEARLAGHAVGERAHRAAALLLGVAGFLPLSPAEATLGRIDPAMVGIFERRWRQLGAPWQGVVLSPTVWTVTRQRPAAHPVRRLLALATLLARPRVGLVEDLMALVAQDDASRALRRWFTGDNPYLGQAHAHEVIVNVVVPFALAYAEAGEEPGLAAAASQLWDRLPRGAGNAVLRRTVEQICGPHPVPIRSARAEQGLLHLHRTGCTVMRCYECPIAHLALAHGSARTLDALA